MKAVDAVKRAIHAISTVLVWISGITLFGISALSFINVFGRYVLQMPIKGTEEICAMCLIVIIFGALPYATIIRRHIVVDALTSLFPRALQAAVAGACSVLCCLFSALLTWKLMGRGITLLATSSTFSAILHIPYGPFYLYAALSCAILALEFLIDASLRFADMLHPATLPAEGGDQA